MSPAINFFALYAKDRSQSFYESQKDHAFFDLEVSCQLRQNDIQVIEHGETRECKERNFVRELNEIRIFWSVKKPLRNELGEIIGMYGISTDITERKHMERKLQEQNDLRYGNRRLAERFNVPEGEFDGIPIRKVVDAESAQLIIDNNHKVFQSGEAERFKERATDPNGREQVCKG